jgi:PAS domain S-box-containing protein
VLPEEASRLAALRRYAILDSPPDEAFDRVARLAASLFRAPIALICFLDAERAWFKSHIGVDIAEIPRDITLRARTVLSDEITLVPDALEDPTFAGNPLVGELGVRFYAGAPLITRDGHRIGVLCVVDRKPRSEFSAEDQSRLATLARLVMNELELKRELAVRASVERDLALANEALVEREKMFRLLFESNPIAMWVRDIASHECLEVNQAAVEQYGYSRERFLALPMSDLLVDYRELGFEDPRRAPLLGRFHNRRHRKADGSIILVDLIAEAIEFGGRRASLVAAIDVTEQRRAVQEARRAKEVAEAASQAKSELLANMSHELRTPLNAIIGFSEIMQTGLFGPLGSVKYEAYVVDIRDSASHLLQVITDILDIAKIEANSFRLDEANFDPAAVIASAIRLMKPRADAALVRIEFENPALGVQIVADEIALKRVVLNLLSNAVKFSTPGSAVTVRSEVIADGRFKVSVADRGIGMAPEEVPLALTPFRQINSGLQRRYEGTGLGLPIAKQLVELHGGELVIESAPGLGTTVSVLLAASRILPVADLPSVQRSR